ncbi:MAG TPA: carbohydrate kinase family protein [Anaerolineae bacterium]|nr:carbohydrate kinase family protein [Anaerolineae bacterium]
MTLDVVTVGPLNVDLLIRGTAPADLAELTRWVGPSDVTITAAGSNGYATLAFAKLGLRTGVVCVLADDVLGDVVLQEMIRAGVDVSHIARQPQTQTGIGIYLLLFGSKKRPLTYRYPTHHPWPNPLGQADREYLLSGRHIHCAGYLHYREMWNDDLAQLYQAAQSRGLTTSFDPQGMLVQYKGAWIEPVRDILKYTDLFLVDAHEAAHLTLSDDVITAALVLQQCGPRTVVVKNGAQGTFVCTPEQSFLQPAYVVPEEEIVDTVGAGDTFDAAFVTGFLCGWSLERCAKFASAAAASSLRGAGGVIGLAAREELERRLDQA